VESEKRIMPDYITPGLDPRYPLKRATSIGPDKYAQWRTDHPILSSVGDFVTGGATDPEKKIGLSDVAMAGIPFAAPAGKVFHGTINKFEHFDPNRYNLGDILGNYTHFTENPELADSWVQSYKNGIPIANKGFKGTNIRPATLDIKNAVDISDRDMDPRDLVKILKVAPESEKDHIVGAFVNTVHNRNSRINYLQRSLYDTLRRPEVLKEAGFDGVKYYDAGGGGPSWAVPETTQIKSPWGLPQGKINKPSRMLPGIEPETKGNTFGWDDWSGTPIPEKFKENPNLPLTSPRKINIEKKFNNPTNIDDIKLPWEEASKEPWEKATKEPDKLSIEDWPNATKLSQIDAKEASKLSDKDYIQLLRNTGYEDMAHTQWMYSRHSQGQSLPLHMNKYASGPPETIYKKDLINHLNSAPADAKISLRGKEVNASDLLQIVKNMKDGIISTNKFHDLPEIKALIERSK
jgi:hypothetical protein